MSYSFKRVLLKQWLEPKPKDVRVCEHFHSVSIRVRITHWPFGGAGPKGRGWGRGSGGCFPGVHWDFRISCVHEFYCFQCWNTTVSQFGINKVHLFYFMQSICVTAHFNNCGSGRTSGFGKAMLSLSILEKSTQAAYNKLHSQK